MTRFVTKLCAPPSEGTVPVEVVPLSETIVDHWHKKVQPLINLDATRPDHGWDWRFITWTTRVAGLLQQPRGYALCLSATSQFPTDATPFNEPYALVQLLEHTTSPVDGHSAVFVFYLSTRPHRDDAPYVRLKPLGKATLDIAIVRAFLLGYVGRVWLHASPRGENLLMWYPQCGMSLIPATTVLPFPRRNDGRYFNFSPLSASGALASLDFLR